MVTYTNINSVPSLISAIEGVNAAGGMEVRADANWSTTSRDSYLNLLVSKGTDAAGRVAARFDPSNVFTIFDKVGTPAAGSNRIKLYSDSRELKVIYSAGNTTTLSSHNPQMVDPSGRPTSYVHSERNPFTGKHIEIDIYKMAQVLEQLSGETLIHIQELPETDKLDWAENEARQVAEREFERQQWQAMPEERRVTIEPEIYTERPEPQFLNDARNWRTLQ